MRPVVVLAALAVVVLAGCGAEAPPPAPLPGVVSSVERSIPGSGTALTVTQGAASYRIFNVMFDQAGSGSECEVRSDTDAARRLLVGRTVATTKYFERWDDPAVPAGYTPAQLTFVTAEGSRDDLRTGSGGFSYVAAQARAKACPNREEAPLSGRSVEPGPERVDVEMDDEGESRYCSRRWWC